MNGSLTTKTIAIIFTVLCLIATADMPAKKQKDHKLISTQNDDNLVVHIDGSGDKQLIKWSDAVGRRVVAEGIAWIDFKGLGTRLILDGTTVYVEQPGDFGKSLGKLVRVEGVLKTARYDAGPPTSQTLGGDFYYYTFSKPQWQEIDRVQSPGLSLVDGGDR